MRRALAALALVSCAPEKKAEPVEPSMTIEPVLTISGTTTIERGECIGFRVQTANFDMDDPRLYLGTPMYEISPYFWYLLDSNTLQVGFPCFYTSLGMPLGEARITILDGERALSAPAFTVIETIRVPLGDAPADSAGAPEDDANELGHAHDFDVYRWNAPVPALYASEVLVVDTANAAFKPYQFVVRRDSGGSWNGHEVVLFPISAEIELYSQVADDTTGGGAGYAYTLRAEAMPSPAPLFASDGCAASLSTAGLFTIDLASAGGDFDPQAASSCADRHVPQPPAPGEGVDAPGPERTLLLHVPAGASLQVAAFSIETDVALYLVPLCGAPSLCVAAADTFGQGATETLQWRAESDADMWLHVDTAGGTPGSVTVRIRVTP